MFYCFTDELPETDGKNLIATAANGIVYAVNNELHVKTNTAHFVYKYEATPAGWYQRNIKTLEDFYLGKGACPTAVFEKLNIIDETLWASILQPVQTETEGKK